MTDTLDIESMAISDLVEKFKTSTENVKVQGFMLHEAMFSNKNEIMFEYLKNIENNNVLLWRNPEKQRMNALELAVVMELTDESIEMMKEIIKDPEMANEIVSTAWELGEHKVEFRDAVDDDDKMGKLLAKCLVQRTWGPVRFILKHTSNEVRTWKNEMGMNQLQIALWNTSEVYAEVPDDIIVLLLQDMPTDYRMAQTKTGLTTLNLACFKNMSVGIIRCLLHGMPKSFREIVDNKGMTPLMNSCMKGASIEVLRLLLADMPISYRELRCENGQTALMYLMRSAPQLIGATKLVIQDMNIEHLEVIDKRGTSALILACYKGAFGSAVLLLRKVSNEHCKHSANLIGNALEALCDFCQVPLSTKLERQVLVVLNYLFAAYEDGNWRESFTKEHLIEPVLKLLLEKLKIAKIYGFLSKRLWILEECPDEEKDFPEVFWYHDAICMNLVQWV